MSLNENVLFDLFKTVDTYGKYFGLFYMVLIFLIGKKGLVIYEAQKNTTTGFHERKQEILLYSLIMLLFLWNPIIITALIKVFPGLQNGFLMILMLPVIPIIALGTTELLCMVKKGRRRHILGVSLFLIVLLSGGIATQDSKTITKNLYGADEKYIEALDYIPKDTPVMLIAEEELMASARRYNPAIEVAYGRDLWESDINIQPYEEQCYRLRECLLDQENNMDELLEIAVEMNCDYLILDNVASIIYAAGDKGFVFQESTDDYCILKFH